MCDLNCFISWFLTIFKLISIPLYITVLIVLIKRRRQLKSSFFRLCISVGIADLAMLLMRFLFDKVPKLLWNYWPASRAIIDSTTFATAKNMLPNWGFYYVQVFGIVILSVNRLTGICLLDNAELFWSKTKMALVIFFQWFWLFPFSLPQLNSYCHSKLADNDSFVVKFEHEPAFNVFYSISVFLECGILTPTLVIMHIVMFIKSVKHKSRVVPHNEEPQANMLMEVQYATIGLILCGTYIFLTVNWVMIWSNGGVYGQGHILVIDIGVALFATINPYLLLCFCAKFRQVYVDFMKSFVKTNPYRRKSLYKTSSSNSNEEDTPIEFHRFSRVFAARGARPGDPDRPIYYKESSTTAF